MQRNFGTGLLLTVMTVLWMEVSAQSWVSEVERALDQRIRDRDFGLILEDVRLSDLEDGLTSYMRAKYRRKHVAPPKGRNAEDIDRDGDQHTLAFAKVRSVLLRNCELRADAVEEALKLSASRDVVIDRCILHGGSEDALDVVRGSRLVFRDVTFIARGARAVTIKGGVSEVDFIRCVFTGEPTTGYFLELGGWTLYDVLDRPPVTAVRIDDATRFEVSASGTAAKPIRLLHAEPPSTTADVDAMPGPMVDAFFKYKRWETSDEVLERVRPANLCWDLDPCPIPVKKGKRKKER